MKVRSSLSQFTLAAAGKYLRGHEVDNVERAALVETLKHAVENKPDNEIVNCDGFDLTLQPGSSLYQLYRPASLLLIEMLQSAAVQNMFERERIEERHIVAVTSEGRMIVLGSEGDKDVARYFNTDPVMGPWFHSQVEAARAAGGEIWADDVVGVPQWLRFHELNVPNTVAQIKNLVSFLEMRLPAGDHLGNYWEYLTGHDSASVVLTAVQYAEIRALTARWVPPNQTLLDTLYQNALPTLSGTVNWQNANESIAHLVRHPFSQAYAKKYLEGLDWYGAKTGETINEEELDQLLITAILLDLDPGIGNVDKRNHVGAHDVFGAHYVDHHQAVLRQGLETYLINNKKVSREAAPLATHLLLAQVAPEFLVKNIPPTLLAGSVGWATFSQSVAMVELGSKGASRNMTFEQVMKFAEIEPVNESLAQLQGLTAIESIIDWALLNGVITHQALSASPKETCDSAVSVYQAHLEVLAQVSGAFSAPLPDRRTVALADLKTAAPGCDFLEQEVLRHYTDNLSQSYKMSMLDLHIEGQLASGEWDLPSGASLYQRYPQLYQLTSNQLWFEELVLRHHTNLQRALMTNIKLALSQMPSADREVFQKNDVAFFTVRPSVSVPMTQPVSSVGLVGTNTRPSRPGESQASKDAATGRYGIVMYAAHGNNEMTCYELFTLRGECRKNTRLGEVIRDTGKMDMPARLGFTGDMTELTPAIVATPLPIDLNSYTQGTEASAAPISTVVIEKLGTQLQLTVFENKRSAYQHFMNPQFHLIAQFIAAHRPLATVDELKEVATVLTKREQTHATAEKVVSYVVDLVVPFKKCIEDIASGEKNRVVDGVFGCIMDGVGMVASAVGVATKVMTIAARTVSLTAKAASFAKFGVKLTVSVFNPIDGLPTLAYRGSTRLCRSGLKLTRQGAQVAEAATFQLRKLTGKAQSVDLIQTANLPHIAQGTWRPRGSTADALSVCAVRNNDQWYAVNRHGRPWGKRLVDFDFGQVFCVPKSGRTLPLSCTRQIIEHSLPVAIQKIDNAITALSTRRLEHETDLAIGLLLGSTPQARDDMLGFLKIVKTDFNGTSGSNFLLDSAKADHSIVELDPDQYRVWKDADRAVNQPYMTINPHNVNNRFSASGLTYGAIADDLVHEMFRGQPDIGDFCTASHARTQGSGSQALDVASLLNLASGQLPVAVDDVPIRYHDSSKARSNADSYALATALLSQLVSDKPAYLKNIGIMRAAGGYGANIAINGEVAVSLNTD
ncbi:MAG: hypothetical protein ABWZ65_03310 [Pseudomonas mandelii]